MSDQSSEQRVQGALIQTALATADHYLVQSDDKSHALGILAAAVRDLTAERERLREALEQIAEHGGWITTWHIDQANPEAGDQPTLTNRAQDIARAALNPTEQA